LATRDVSARESSEIDVVSLSVLERYVLLMEVATTKIKYPLVSLVNGLG